MAAHGPVPVLTLDRIEPTPDTATRMTASFSSVSTHPAGQPPTGDQITPAYALMCVNTSRNPSLVGST